MGLADDQEAARAREGGSAFVYRIDADDRVTDVDEAWLQFARQNNAGALDRQSVCGRSLWSFISDAATAHLYQHLVAHARSTGERVVVPFRCDSPDTRRYMELEVVPLAGGTIEITSRMLREERRDRVPLLSPTSEVDPDEPLLRMCSWCKKVRVPEGWIEIERAVATLDLFARTTLPGITHGMCESCHQRLFECHPATAAASRANERAHRPQDPG